MLARTPKQHALYAPQDHAPVYRLVDAKTGETVALPAARKCWDGYEITIRDFEPIKYETSGGKIYTTMNEVFVPSVCGLKIVQVAP